MESKRQMIQLPKECSHADYVTLFDFWRAGCHDSAEIPKLRDLDLMDIYSIAPNIVIIDMEGGGDGRRFLWRYAGSGIRHLTGMEITNRYVDEIYDPDAKERCEEIYNNVCETHQPHAWEYSVRVAGYDNSSRDYERLLLPVANDNGETRHLIGLYIFSLSHRHGATGERGYAKIQIEPQS
jgi:hypothetical protein